MNVNPKLPGEGNLEPKPPEESVPVAVESSEKIRDARDPHKALFESVDDQYRSRWAKRRERIEERKKARRELKTAKVDINTSLNEARKAWRSGDYSGMADKLEEAGRRARTIGTSGASELKNEVSSTQTKQNRRRGRALGEMVNFLKEHKQFGTFALSLIIGFYIGNVLDFGPTDLSGVSDINGIESASDMVAPPVELSEADLLEQAERYETAKLNLEGVGEYGGIADSLGNGLEHPTNAQVHSFMGDLNAKYSNLLGGDSLISPEQASQALSNGGFTLDGKTYEIFQAHPGNNSAQEFFIVEVPQGNPLTADGRVPVFDKPDSAVV